MASKLTTKRPSRNGITYLATYDGKVLVKLYNPVRDAVIPPHTQTFRYLADNNRGNKFRIAPPKKKVTERAAA